MRSYRAHEMKHMIKLDDRDVLEFNASDEDPIIILVWQGDPASMIASWIEPKAPKSTERREREQLARLKAKYEPELDKGVRE